MEERLPLRHAECGHGVVGWREAGAGPALVLLHGIGSGSLAWAGQLDALRSSHRVLAWDAPGYAESAPLPNPRPLAVDYAHALEGWLRRLDVAEMTLVGHSLGALMAAAFAALPAAARRPRVRALVLASPARGYASASAEVREAKWRERIALIERLGSVGLAAQRCAGLCAPGAPAAVLEQVRWNMARVTPGGYAQAAHMLAHDDLAAQLRSVRAPVSVWCGELDRVTPLDACEQLARETGASFRPLRGVAHACYVEDPAQFNAELDAALASAPQRQHV